MEPFSPDDPVFRLLGKARPVEPRGNFTQNVMRAVRQAPQRDSGWDRFKEAVGRWVAPRPLAGLAFAAVAVFLAGTWFLNSAVQDSHSGNHGVAMTQGESHGVAAVTPTASSTQQPTGTTPAAAVATTTEPDVVSVLDQMDEFNQLLAAQDTKSLSDSDVAALLY